MGNSSWDRPMYAARSMDYASKSRDQLFQKKSIRKDFDPVNIDIRESCDSEANPESTALIFALDVTGSMGFIAEAIAKNGLGKIVEGILDEKPVTDPHIMMMAIGDAFHDHHPIQVTQFEADIKIADQLVDLYLEGGGGANNFESYDLAWAFAATKTSIDCFEKRGKKGYLFTIGDEMTPRTPDNSMMDRLGVDIQSDMTAEQLLQEVKNKYHVFHIIVEEGNYVKHRGVDKVHDAWEKLIGKRAIVLDDYNNLPEVAISAIMVNEGADPDEVIARWQDQSIRNSVSRSLYGPSVQH